MTDRAAEADGGTVAVAVELVERIGGASLGGQRGLECCGVELAGAPGDLSIGVFERRRVKVRQACRLQVSFVGRCCFCTGLSRTAR